MDIVYRPVLRDNIRLLEEFCHYYSLFVTKFDV